MNGIEAIKMSINGTSQITSGYLADLTDEELFHRPHPGCNHINWQVGHLIVAENGIMNKVTGGKMPDLPAGFADRYAMEKTSVDDRGAFVPKHELLAAGQAQRAATLATLESLSDGDLDKPSGMDWAPTMGAAINAAASMHWMMHAGQWAVIRRQLGHKPLF